MASDNEASSGSKTESFWTSLVLSSGIGLVLWLLFILVLRRRFMYFYLPRAFQRKKWSPELNQNRSWFSWISYTIHYPEARIFATRHGYDTVLYLRFLRYTALLFLILSGFTLPLLLPINITGENKDLPPSDSEYVGDEITYSTLANVGQGSHRLWAHFWSVWFVSLIAYYYIWKNYQSSIFLNIRYAKKSPIQSRTVLVSELPNTIKTDQDLEHLFRELYGENRILCAKIAPEVNKLREEREERLSLLNQWRYAKAVEREKGERTLMRTSKVPCKGEKVDAINYTAEKLALLDDKIAQAGKEIKQVTRCGFVTFTTAATALACAQTQHETNPFRMQIKYAPDHHNVFWQHLVCRPRERLIRMVVMGTLLGLLFLFWTIPVTFISALSSLSTLSKVPALDFLVVVVSWNPFVKGLIEGFLPTLALIIFMALLPLILRKLFELCKLLLRTDVDQGVLSSYFAFLLLNVFFVVTIAGSLFTVLSQIIDEPTSIVSLLAKSLPSQSIFFTNYVIIQGFIGYSMQLTRVVPLIILKLKQLILSKSKLEKRDMEAQPIPYEFPLRLAEQLLIFCIAMIYSSICPIINPFACIYFGLAYFVAKYNLVFVCKNKYHGFRMTPQIVNITTAGLILYQITMMGILALKLFPVTVALVPLFLFTIVYRVALDRKFARSSVMPSLREGLHLDEKEKLLNKVDPAFVALTYTDPTVRIPPSLEDVLKNDGLLELEADRTRDVHIFGENEFDQGKDTMPQSRKEAASQRKVRSVIFFWKRQDRIRESDEYSEEDITEEMPDFSNEELDTSDDPPDVLDIENPDPQEEKAK